MLSAFLDAKPLYYDKIDYTRMPRVYARIKESFELPKIIHIIGTNGKGTTGRFLASALHSIGYSVGHYTSPHIMEFNERIWHNRQNVSMDVLEETHQKLLSILREKEAEALSYFEYTTLLAMLYFSKRCDYVVLEAGLGGEYDATAVFENILTLVTPIDKDHEAFLGESVSDIAKTKLNAIQKCAILAKQPYAKEVNEVLREIQKQKKIRAYSYEELLDIEDITKIEDIAKQEKLASYLVQNLALAVAGLRYLKVEYRAENFYNARLFGRLSVLEKNILVDVGHNELAARSIVASLKDKKYILVYNSYEDKNYEAILSILKPIISSVELIDVYNVRVAKSGFLQKTLENLGIKYSRFKEIERDRDYLVFGSFSVVEAFMKVYRG